jgi:CBS-domain-containing membrane protein
MPAPYSQFLTSWAKTAYARPASPQILTAGIGGALAVSLVGAAGLLSGSALLMAPLGATAVLLFALPDSPLSAPRHVVGGHALSMFIGVLCLFLVSLMTASPDLADAGPVADMLGAGLGTGAAIACMMATRTVHPPAGANPMLLIFSGLSMSDATLLIALPGVFGAVLLYLVAALGRRTAP